MEGLVAESPPPRPTSDAAASPSRAAAATTSAATDSRPSIAGQASAATPNTITRGHKRPRDSSMPPTAPPPSAKIGTQPRQIELVIFSGYEIKTEYASPYPFPSDDASTAGSHPTHGPGSTAKLAGASSRPASTHPSRFNGGTPRERPRKPVASPIKLKPATDIAATATTSSSLASESSILAHPELGPASEPTISTRDGASPEPGILTPPTPPAPPAEVSDAKPSSIVVEQTVPQSPSESSEASDEIVAALVVPPTAMHDASFTGRPEILSRRSSVGHLLNPPPNPSSAPPSPIPLSIAEDEIKPELTEILITPTPPAAEPASSSIPPPTAPTTTVKVSMVSPTPLEPPLRGHAGRFLPKPFHETVRGRRQLARLAHHHPSNGTPSGGTARSHRPSTSAVAPREGSIGPSSSSRSNKEALAEPIKRMWVCEGCFKYMLEGTALVKHLKECTYKHPPGQKVYQRGAHTVWEVDGAVEKLWCQNLCLFGKLFIEHKYMFFDLEGFMFYVVTDATPSRDWPLAYFSKEKLSYDDYNLACIVTFPPYRSKGWAALLIELSYEITRRRPSPSGLPGTPERPLSASGLASYRTYWTGTLVRYLRACFEQRRALPLVPIEGSSPSRRKGQIGMTTTRKRTSSRGWEGEILVRQGMDEGRELRDEEGDQGERFEVPTNLVELAARVHLRPEDVAFVLVDSGLAQWRRSPIGSNQENEGEADEGDERGVLELCITPEVVEKVAQDKKVKERGVLSMAYVLL